MARTRKGEKVDGWVILDKPVGLGSTQAVGKVRRLFGAQKAGHGGTLDPLATAAFDRKFSEVYAGAGLASASGDDLDGSLGHLLEDMPTAADLLDPQDYVQAVLPTVESR